ncbi:MAG: hypothetical protein WDZ46_09725 [Solirubrobacterales bacterium]
MGTRRAGVLARLGTAIALAAAALVALAPAANASHSTSSILGDPKRGHQGGFFTSPSDVAVNQSSGQIYVADGDRIQRFDSEGNFERAWGRGVVAPGGTGDVPGQNEVQEISVTGEGGTFALSASAIGLDPGLVEPRHDLIAVSGDGGSFTIEVGNISSGPPPMSTAPIPHDATAAEVEEAIEAVQHVGPGNVAVSGPAGGPWDIAIAAGLTAPRGGSAADAQSGVPVVGADASGLTGPSPSASRQSGEYTTAIPRNASAAEVQAALEALDLIGAGNVSVAGPAGGPWAVEFTGIHADADMRPLSGDASGLTGASPAVEATTTQQSDTAFEICTVASECRLGVSARSGAFYGFLGGELRAPDHIAVDSNSGDVYVTDDNNRISAFDADGNFLRVFGPGVVASGGTGDVPTDESQRLSYERGKEANGGFFSLNFAGQSTATRGKGDLNNGSKTITNVTASQGAFAVGQGIAGGGIPKDTTITAVGPGTLTISKTIVVNSVGGVDLHADDLLFDATGADVQAALERLAAIEPGDVAVSGPAAGPWSLQFGGAYADTDVPQTFAEGQLTSATASQGIIRRETKTAGGGYEVCTVPAECLTGSSGGDAAGQLGGFGTSPDSGGSDGPPLAVGPSGNLFVYDSANGRVSEYEGDGSFLRSWGWGVDSESEALEICTAASGCHRGLPLPFGETAPNGHLWARFTGGGNAIAVDAAGVVYASNADHNSGGSSPLGPRLERFDSTKAGAGELLAGEPIRSENPGPELPAGPLPGSPPRDLASDPGSGNLYYAANTAVHEIDPGPPAAVGLHLDGYGAFHLAHDEAGDRLLASRPSDSRVAIATDPGAPPPLVSLEEPEASGNTSVLLSGEVTPDGPPGIRTYYRFEYRKAGSEAWTKLPAIEVNLGEGTEAIEVSQEASGLEVSVPYEARLVATRELAAGQATSEAQSFVLGDLPPTVLTAHPASRTATEAFIAGTVDTRNQEATYYFEWGQGEAGPYEHRVPVPDGSLAALDGPQRVVEKLVGLKPETAYHYRLLADSGVPVEAGCDAEAEACATEVAGEEVAFTTRAAPGQLQGRAYEMVTPPFKSVRAAVATSARVGNNANPGFPSLDGETIAWHVSFFPLDDTVGAPSAADRRLIRRTPAGWAHETLNTLPLTPESDPLFAQFSSIASSGDLEAQPLRMFQGTESKALLPTEGPVQNRYYTFRKGTGTLGHTPWLDNPHQQVIVPGEGGLYAGQLTPGRYSDFTSADRALLNDDGTAMARWGLYAGLAEDPASAGDEDPSDSQPLNGKMIYTQRVADPLAMPAAPKDLVNECTGTSGGEDATLVPARGDAGTPEAPEDDTIGAAECEAGSLTHRRGATVGGGGGQRGPAASALAGDGRHVFFESPDASAAQLGCPSGGEATDCTAQLFVRRYGSLDPDDAVVRWISRSRSEAVPGADNTYAGAPIAGQSIGLFGSGAFFQGASRDGRVVYFKTNAPLTPDDANGSGTPGPKTSGQASDASWDLYRYQLPPSPADPEDGQLTRVSGGPGGIADPNTNPHIEAGLGAGATLRYLSGDGARAYFLTGAPIAGADATPPAGGATTPGTATGAASGTTRNLYLYDASEEGAERWRFVARLPFSHRPGRGGAGGGPANLEGLNHCAGYGELVSFGLNTFDRNSHPTTGNCFRGTPDGSHVAFQTAGRLSGEDADGAGDVYLYDAEADELVRVSAPPPGAEPYVCNGDIFADDPRQPGQGCNGDLGFPSQGGLSSNGYGRPDSARGFGGFRHHNLATNPDGTVSLFFQSRSQLVPEDANGDHYDTYEWREGELSLVSPGNQDHNSWYSGNSLDGQDVFIATSQRIDPREIDDFDFDLYDARRGGGFPYTPPPQPCDVLAGACEGEALAPPALRLPDSLATGPSGNVRRAKRRGGCRKPARRARKLAGAAKRARRAARRAEGRRVGALRRRAARTARRARRSRRATRRCRSRARQDAGPRRGR